MSTTIEVVFDGKTFVPTKPVDLPAGTKANVEVPAAVSSCSEVKLSLEEAECILRGDGNPPPWQTVAEALAATRGEVWRDSPATSVQQNTDTPKHGYTGPIAGSVVPSRPLTDEEEAAWIAFMRAARSTPPSLTFEEYLRERRGE